MHSESLVRVIWLHGEQGTRKSAIMQMLAEWWGRGTDRLGATLFLQEHHTPQFTNYDLYLQELLGFVHPHITSYTLGQQFKEMIHRPFKKLRVKLFAHSELVFILLDSLDSGQHSNKTGDLNNLIAHIVQFAEDCPDAPIRWVISAIHIYPPMLHQPKSIMALQVTDVTAEFLMSGFQNSLSQAAFDLFHCPPPPPCHPSTKVELLTGIRKWVQCSGDSWSEGECVCEHNGVCSLLSYNPNEFWYSATVVNTEEPTRDNSNED
ncbi:hypothetical protein P691DRAFT_786900 [Macrolepiota fuliginosa MF-IS2]|uniref:NACHT domain-containing protein n=1 Tax=Macrolepiota fuliginosa MF-IS2 TaxID=1400762 RepID=A0A9P6BVI3_9AGAR|nr:hypothetical protein P691DRAFT_786900 [Macrolepiota fuliginosa MF-IS2]